MEAHAHCNTRPHCTRCGKYLDRQPDNAFGWCGACEAWAQMGGWPQPQPVAPPFSFPVPVQPILVPPPLNPVVMQPQVIWSGPVFTCSQGAPSAMPSTNGTLTLVGGTRNLEG